MKQLFLIAVLLAHGVAGAEVIPVDVHNARVDAQILRDKVESGEDALKAYTPDPDTPAEQRQIDFLTQNLFQQIRVNAYLMAEIRALKLHTKHLEASLHARQK